MSRIVTALGVIYAVALAVSPDLVAINATAARYAMLLGLAAAAAGKALTAEDVREVRGLLGGFPRRGMFASRPAVKKAVAFALCAGLLASSAACGIKDTSGEALTILRTDAVNYVTARERAGALTAEQAEAQRARFTRLADAFAPVDAKIQAAQKLDARTAADILPEVEAFVRALDAENVINLPSGPVARRIGEFDFVLRGLVGRILNDLRRRGRVDEAGMRRDVARLKELVAV